MPKEQCKRFKIKPIIGNFVVKYSRTEWAKNMPELNEDKIIICAFVPDFRKGLSERIHKETKDCRLIFCAAEYLFTSLSKD